jgi:hypothetical protein
MKKQTEGSEGAERLTFSDTPPHAPHQPPSPERGSRVHPGLHPWELPTSGTISQQ